MLRFGEFGLKMVDAREPEELMTPSQVAAMFRVNSKTVARWARTGRISCVKTPGGHRRFRASDVRDLLAAGASDASR
jgi:excisionase family DNA binding protein